MMMASPNSKLNPDEKARKPYGTKKITNREYAAIVSKLLVGDPNIGKAPKTISEIATDLGYKNRHSIYDFRDLAIELKMLELDESGNPIIPKKDSSDKFRDFVKKEDFCNDEYVVKLVKYLEQLNLKSAPTVLNCFKQVCRTLKVNPVTFITYPDPLNPTIDSILEQGRELTKQFVDLYMNGEATIKKKPNITRERIAYPYSKAVRYFMGVYGFHYSDGEKGVMSQSISSFHGNYSDVKLSDEQIEQAEKYLIDNYGLDSDIFRWFFVGLESCSRKIALFNMKSNYEKEMMKGKEIYVMVAFESKTAKIKKGKWYKYITRANTKKSIDLVKERSSYLIENRSMNYINTVLYPQLKELYKFLKVDKIHLEHEDDENTGYFMQHNTHCLRHSGAHLWLRRTKYRYEVVAKIGGWNKIDELKDSYGEMPHSMMADIIGDALDGKEIRSDF